jgi:hypothetical protein
MGLYYTNVTDHSEVPISPKYQESSDFYSVPGRNLHVLTPELDTYDPRFLCPNIGEYFSASKSELPIRLK